MTQQAPCDDDDHLVRFFQELVEGTPDAVIVLEEGAPHSLIANTAAVALLGYSRAELMQMCPLDLLAPSEHPRVSQAKREFRETGRWRGEWQLIQNGGGTVFADIAVSRHRVGERVLIACLMRDSSTLRQAEQQVDKREIQYRRIVETAQEGIWEIDGEARTTFVNQRMADMLGTTVERLLEASPFDFIDEAWRAEATEHLSRRTRGIADRRETRLRRADGREIWVIVSANPVYDADGQYDGVLALVSDITERKTAENELARREMQLAEAQQLAQIGSWEWDVSTGLATWSDEMYRIVGVGRDVGPLTMESSLAWQHPDDLPRVRAIIEASIASGEPFACDARLVRPDGEVRHIHRRGTVVRDERGRPVRIVGTIQDITERVQANERIRELNARLAEALAAAERREQELLAVLEQTPDIVIRYDRDLRMLYVNGAAERASGFTAADLLGRTAQEAGMRDDMAEGWEVALRQVFASGREQTVEMSSSQGLHIYQTRLTPVFGQDGTVESVVCTARDISEQAHAAAERERLYQALMEREERLHRLVQEIFVGGQAVQKDRDRAATVREQLTPRELEIVRLLAEGRTNQQIGQALGLGAGTVKNHVSRLLPKLGATSRTQAATLVVELGL